MPTAPAATPPAIMPIPAILRPVRYFSFCSGGGPSGDAPGSVKVTMTSPLEGTSTDCSNVGHASLEMVCVPGVVMSPETGLPFSSYTTPVVVGIVMWPTVEVAPSQKLCVSVGATGVTWVVQSAGGTIRVRSEPGQGATFTIELPVRP